MDEVKAAKRYKLLTREKDRLASAGCVDPDVEEELRKIAVSCRSERACGAAASVHSSHAGARRGRLPRRESVGRRREAATRGYTTSLSAGHINVR